jgi:hypothetical protein
MDPFFLVVYCFSFKPYLQTCAEHAETISGLRAELQDALAELDRATADKAALDTQCQALQARVASLESSESVWDAATVFIFVPYMYSRREHVGLAQCIQLRL